MYEKKVDTKGRYGDEGVILYYNAGLDYADTDSNYDYYVGEKKDKQEAISNQLGILQEECAELIQAISKYKRGKDKAYEMLKEEITHVAISISMVTCALGITNADIKEELNKKFGSRADV